MAKGKRRTKVSGSPERSIRGVLNPEMVGQVCEYAELGATAADIAAACGINPQTFYNWMRVGEIVANGEAAGSDVGSVASEIGCAMTYARNARSLYVQIGAARARGNVRTLRNLRVLIDGYGPDDAIPSIPPSLAAIKLRLSLADGYEGSGSAHPLAPGAVRVTLESGSNATLSDLQHRYEALPEPKPNDADGLAVPYELEADDADGV